MECDITLPLDDSMDNDIANIKICLSLNAAALNTAAVPILKEGRRKVDFKISLSDPFARCLGSFLTIVIAAHPKAHSAHMLNMSFFSFPHNLIIFNSSTTNFPS